ncbi:phytase [Lentinula boryana]|uniref:Phytase A n=1 Tax=Lentinula boryana TaxID=40481 RepID=A0ABQ8Q5J8_9AGAR|nr:phytase [Lentinula boryana]
MLPNILYVLSLTILPIFRVFSGLGGSVYANNQLTLQLEDETPERRTSQTHILQRNWGAYSPYHPVAEYVPPPEGCEITQVNILQRHGARYPTAGPAAAIALAVTKLQNVSTFKDPNLEFIRNFTWNLGTSDLVLFGAAQSLVAGAETYHRYNGLVSSDNIPFVRASGSERVIMSATNWTYGFSAASGMRFNPILSVILNESANNTLHNSCPSIGSSDTQTDIWIGIYTEPIVQRLNDAAPGAKLTVNDVYYLMALCAFESVAIDVISDWCGLFDEDEWKGFEYEMDLDKYYGTGYGQLLGPVEGVGYINELIARLTSRPVNDTTQTNSTLDHSPTTFPLNRTIYADFSHDDQLVAIYSAMGLFKQPMALDPTSPLDFELLGNGLDRENTKRTWIASHLVPFSGRMVVEKMQCRQLSSEDYMRILVNDAVQPLEFCSGVTPEGVCSVSAFVESQGYATSGGNGDWQKCFE